MKIDGKGVAGYTRKEITFKRPNGQDIKLTVRAVPFGWQREYTRVFPRPSAPTTTTQTNSSIEVKSNFSDPKFITDIKEWTEYEGQYLVYLLIKDSPGLTFDNPPIDVASLKRFSEELSASGLSEFEVASIAQTGREISLLSADEVAEERKSFSLK